jgi:L-amino acid N-acyltransferase YncA
MNRRFTRRATPEDAAVIAQIYNQGMEDRTATFETTHRSAGDIRAWFEHGYPVHVAGVDQAVKAYAVAFPYRPRACYDGVREFSVYVAREARGQGFGKAAVIGLIDDAKMRGWWKLLSRIFPENVASRKLCAALGFREVGVYEKHGQLDGRWMDTVIVEKLLT